MRLEHRICAEFQGCGDPRLRKNWCDGLIAEEYELLSARPTIRGRAWCGPTGQEPWLFTLVLDSRTRSREEIDRSLLLPSDRLTGWLMPHPQQRSMTIDPLRGCPD